MDSTTTLLLIDIGIYVTYALLGVAVLGALASTVKGIVSRPGKGLIMFAVGLIGALAVFFVAWTMSSGADISEILLEKTGTSQWWIRPVGTGMIMFYMLFACAILAVIGTEVMRPFKK